MAEIETRTRYRATAFAIETDCGVALADRVLWLPVDLLGQLAPDQRDQVIAGSSPSRAAADRAMPGRPS